MNWKKIWYFIWHDNSIWSWIVNIILAFVLIKYIVYPVLGLVLGTGFPVVAVVSSSMEHNSNFDEWFESQKDIYSNYGISKEDFKSYKFKNGFNKGDIMILMGVNPEKIQIGEVLVFRDGKPDPFIHRIVAKKDDNGYIFETKGDNNPRPIRTDYLDETNIGEDQLIGRAVFRIPYLGFVKIWFVDFIQLFS